MCYAVTALRVLTHAPWSDNMFHGHIRELVLCAIGNGWTWTDQTATVQGRRVSIGEVCAAFASYLNLNAFPRDRSLTSIRLLLQFVMTYFQTTANSFLHSFK